MPGAASGRDDEVVIVKATRTTIRKSFVAVCNGFVDVACRVKSNVPANEGVPVSDPFDPNEMPGGRILETTDHDTDAGPDALTT